MEKQLWLLTYCLVKKLIEIYTCHTVNLTASVICFNNKDRYIEKMVKGDLTFRTHHRISIPEKHIFHLNKQR